MRPDYLQVREWVIEMRQGSTEARRNLIEAHVGVAFKAASTYNDDDVLSYLLVTLVTAVDEFRISGRDASALPAFLKVSCRNGAIKWLEKEKNYPKLVMRSRMKENDESEPCDVHDFLEEILSCCETERDTMMVSLRLQGMTYHQVAKYLSLSYTTVYNEMKRLELRYSLRRKLTG